MSDQKHRGQFSKKIVVAVTICVTAICSSALWLCWNIMDAKAVTDIVKTYIEYAMVVFVAYSGNSMFEKAILSGRFKFFNGIQQDKKQEEQSSSG